MLLVPLQDHAPSKDFQQRWATVHQPPLRALGLLCPKREAQVHAKIFMGRCCGLSAAALVDALLDWSQLEKVQSIESMVICSAASIPDEYLVPLWRELSMLRSAGRIVQIGGCNLSKQQAAVLIPLVHHPLLNQIAPTTIYDTDGDLVSVVRPSRDEEILRALETPTAPAVVVQSSVLHPEALVVQRFAYLVPVAYSPS